MKFIAKLQKLHRITIPHEVWEIMKLKEGNFEVVSVEVERLDIHGTKI